MLFTKPQWKFVKKMILIFKIQNQEDKTFRMIYMKNISKNLIRLLKFLLTNYVNDIILKTMKN
jgi:hypothetical protein